MRIGPYMVDECEAEIQMVEPLLGSSPESKRLYEAFIASKTNERNGSEEMDTLLEEGNAPGRTVFHRDEHGLFLWDYQLKGFLKETANRFKDLYGIKAMRDKVESYVYVFPRRIRLLSSDGQPLTQPDGDLQRPIRAMTPQGPRVSLVASEQVPAGARMRFLVRIFGNGQRKAFDEIRPDTVLGLLQFGETSGLGQWRSGGYGRFVVTRFVVTDPGVPWKAHKPFRKGEVLLDRSQSQEEATGARPVLAHAG